MPVRHRQRKSESDRSDEEVVTEVTIKCSQAMLDALKDYGEDRGVEVPESIFRILKNSLRRRGYLR